MKFLAYPACRQAGKIKNSRTGFTPLEIAHPKGPSGAQARARFLTGFTLIEVIVVVSITAILAGVMLANFRGGEKSRLVAVAAQQVAQNVRLAQNFSTSLKESGGIVPCGWGIHYLNESGYVLFADGAGCASANPYRYDSSERTQTFLFNDARVKFSSSFNDIFFRPPDSVTYINAGSGNNLEERIRVCLVSDCAGNYKEVVIRGTGVVEYDF